MFKGFGQCLALLAMTAFLVNAQCALSCSLQPVLAAAAEAKTTAHACCPNHKTPARQTRPTSPVPCANATPLSAEARLELDSASSLAYPPVASAAVPVISRSPLARNSSAPLVLARAAAGPGLLSSIGILRV